MGRIDLGGRTKGLLVGLMMARVAEQLASPGIRTALVGAGAAGAATATVLVGDYAYSEDFSTPQARPSGINHAVGIGGGVIGIGGIVGNWAVDGPTSRNPALLGTAIGALAGAYLIAPALKRAMAD